MLSKTGLFSLLSVVLSLALFSDFLPKAGARLTGRNKVYGLVPPTRKCFTRAAIFCSFFFWFSASFLGAQTPLFPVASFDNTVLNQWVPSGSAGFNANGSAAGLDPFWSTATGLDRPRIQSSSLGGAVTMIGNNVNSAARLLSPFLDFSQQDRVYIGFHQYYRHFEGETRLNLYQDGAFLQSILLNSNINQNVETAPSDYLVVDISARVANRNNIRVEVQMSGLHYFWIIDDIGFYNRLPFSPTQPPSLGRYLAGNTYPFAVDTAHWPYVPYQLVVQIAPGADPDSLQAIRDSIGAEKIKDCVCGKIELWEINGSQYFDENGQNPAGGTTDLYSNKLGVGSQTKVDGVDINYYNNILLEPQLADSIPALTDAFIASLPTAQPNAHRIAIIDSGIDYNHPDLAGFIAKKDDSPCYTNDPLGWNFIDEHNNPFDDNSHGTHVAGILADSLRKYSHDSCHYQFIPYKTHDRNGISTLFAVACATFQAIEDSVRIINDSWGFFGDSSVVLSNAIDSAALANISIIAAAGNDRIGLDTLPQYPACYAKDNVIAVAATDTVFFEEGDLLLAQLAPFSNYSNTLVDIAAPGTHIESAIPDSLRGYKSGTSMAAPMVSAAVALSYCCAALDDHPGNDDFLSHRDNIFAWSSTEVLLVDYVSRGRFLGYDQNCRITSTESSEQPNSAGFLAFPNPAGDWLHVRNLDRSDRLATWQLTDIQGRVVRQQRVDFWPSAGQISIAMDGLPQGIYFLFIRGNAYLWSNKILKY